MGKLKDKFREMFANNDKEDDDKLETPEEKKERWTSIRTIYFTMFLMSLGFSIIITAVWPFLEKLDPSAGKEFMGIIVAANPLGQMIFSPIIGYWANKRGSIRLPLLTTIALFIFSSGLYALLEVFEDNRKYWMLGSRFLVGVSSANIAAARSYLSAATRIKERTKAISFVSLAQVLGFVVGPVFQACLTFLGEDGYQIVGNLKLNMFTATGWLNAGFGIVNFSLFLPYFFTEHKIAAKEAMIYQGKTTEKETWKSIKPDYLACWTLIFAFFVLVFSFVLVETLGTAITMDHFAWSKSESLLYMGILMGVGAIVAIVVFGFTNRLTQIFKERKLLLWGGFLITCTATALLLPWGDTPQLALPKNYSLDALRQMLLEPEYANYTLGELVTYLADGDTLLGCPVTQTWCENTRGVLVFQFLLAYICASIGYPLGVTLIQTIFSKLLGPRPQGVWMGLLTGSGCMSRVMGPVYVGFVYSRFGPVWTFSTTTALLILCMVWIQIFNKRLIPPELGEKPKEKEIEVEIKEYKLENEKGGLMQEV